VKQLKNRWGDTNTLKRFVIGIDRSKMKLYDAEDSAQDLVSDSKASANKSSYVDRTEPTYASDDNIVSYRSKQGKKPNFGGLK
jgi:hypothetical protein